MKYTGTDWKYVFNPAAKTIDFSLQPGFEWTNVFAIINLTQNTLIYAVGQTGYGATINSAGTILTLQFNTSAYSSSDVLMFVLDEGNDNLSDLITIFAGAAQDPDMTRMFVDAPGGTVKAPTIETLLRQVVLELRVLNFNLVQVGAIGGPSADLDSLRAELDLNFTDV